MTDTRHGDDVLPGLDATVLTRRAFLAASVGAITACSSDSDGRRQPAASSAATDSAPPRSPTTEAAPRTDPGGTEPGTAGTTTELPPTTTTDTEVDPTLPTDPFTLGVSSGEPDAESVVIWTRLVGVPLDEPVSVEWFVAEDDGTTQTGTVTVDAESGGAVHVLVRLGGAAGFWFRAGGHESVPGRTAPLPADADELRLATASCQNFETGFYAAHRDLADWGPDLVVFLGDFIYEAPPFPIPDVSVREHPADEPVDLDGYRRRYETYLGDEDLRLARAAAPWLVIWDDHEVQNNYTGVRTPMGTAAADFARRRRAAYRAWWEHMPTRLPPPPTDPLEPYVTWRAVDAGDLVSFSLLDTRQFRTTPLRDDKVDGGPPVAGWDDPERTVLGLEQEAWLDDRFARAPGRWHCLAQPVVMTDTRFGDDGTIRNYDQWDGYVPARDRLLGRAPERLVVVSGDLHVGMVGRLGDPSAPAGHEFVTTAISSTPNVDAELAPTLLGSEPVVDLDIVGRGYTRHTVRRDSWTAEYRQVVDVGDPGSDVRTWATFVVDADTGTLARV